MDSEKVMAEQKPTKDRGHILHEPFGSYGKVVNSY